MKKKYPKKENLQGIEVEEFYDKDNNIYGDLKYMKMINYILEKLLKGQKFYMEEEFL